MSRLPLRAAMKLALTTTAAGLAAAAIGSVAWAVDAANAPPQVQPALVNDVGGQPPAASADDGNAPLLPDRPDIADSSGDVLGPLYINHTACISFHVPAGSKKVLQASPDLLAEFDDPARHWELKVAMVIRKTATQLTTRDDLLNPGAAPATQPADATQPAGIAPPAPGLMEITLASLKRSLPAAKVLRQDLTSLPNGDQSLQNNVGLLVVRYTAAGKRRLAQQALIEGNDRVFYVLTLTSPGKADDDAGPDDARETEAVNTFRQVLDSVTLLDRAAIRREQEDRLYCTRTLFVNFTPAKLKASLIPEQWLRVIRDGKDIGYTYICEQQAADIPRIGRMSDPDAVNKITPHIEVEKPNIRPGTDILIGIRSRLINDGIRSDKTLGPIVYDNESWLFTTLDRSHEEWSRETLIDDRLAGPDGKPKKPTFIEELGDSNKRLKNVMLPAPEGDPFGKPQMSVKEDYKLDVEEVNTGAALPPLERDLSPFYTPQAISHLLPRLLPLHEPRGYMFATYVGDAREVMMRYVDVLPQQAVNIMGNNQFAIPIDDRIGIDGAIVTHYYSPAGKYLGSQNRDNDVWIIPSDNDTIQKIWYGNALLVVPNPVRPQQPSGAAADVH